MSRTLGPAVITDFSLWWGAGFDSRTVHLGFTMDKVAKRETILCESPWVPLSVSFHQGSTPFHLSSTLYIIIS